VQRDLSPFEERIGYQFQRRDLLTRALTHKSYSHEARHENAQDNETFEFLFLGKPPIKLANWMAGKFLAALVQQLALNTFLWPVCFELTRVRRAGTALAASIFGLVHLPSPTLVAIKGRADASASRTVQLP